MNRDKMQYTVLFAGHMIDASDRKTERFPARKENIIRDKIREKLITIKYEKKEKITGIAGGACGGDILFHELCEELVISSEVWLALPVEQFKKESVAFAGPQWVKRFDHLLETKKVHVLPGNKNDEGGNVWENANNRMFEEALKNGPEHMTFLALWDGNTGDGDGGTEHMINLAKEKGIEIIIIDINKF